MEILCFELGETHSSGIADCDFPQNSIPFTLAGCDQHWQADSHISQVSGSNQASHADCPGRTVDFSFLFACFQKGFCFGSGVMFLHDTILCYSRFCHWARSNVNDVGAIEIMRCHNVVLFLPVLPYGKFSFANTWLCTNPHSLWGDVFGNICDSAVCRRPGMRLPE